MTLDFKPNGIKSSDLPKKTQAPILKESKKNEERNILYKKNCCKSLDSALEVWFFEDWAKTFRSAKNQISRAESDVK